MAKRDDDLIEQTETPWAWLARMNRNHKQTLSTDTPTDDVPHDEITAAAIYRLSQRVMELEEATVGLLAALTRYRVQHDQQRWSDDRPCDCEMCQQAEQAIKAAKGKL